MSSSLLELRRRDLDKLILTKSISFISYSSAYDLSYGSETRTATTKTVWANVTVTSITDDWVSEGLLQAGDLLGTFRYSYDEETDGTAISPALTPARADELTYQSEKYIVISLEPITLPNGDGIVGYNFTAKPTK